MASKWITPDDMASMSGISDGPASTSGLVSMHCLYSAPSVPLHGPNHPSFQPLCFSFVKVVLKHVDIIVILKVIRSCHVYAHSGTEHLLNVVSLTRPPLSICTAITIL